MKTVIKNKGYKFRLKPNAEQKVYLAKCFGCSRKMYNIYVDLLYKYLESQDYKNGYIKGFKFPTPAKYKSEFIYLKEIDSLALANVQLNFTKAVSKFNNESDKKTYKKSAVKKAKTIGRKLTFRDLKGMPNFKSKKDVYQGFSTNNQDGTVPIINDCYVKIPKLKSSIKFINHRNIPSDCKIKSATISKDVKDKYYISFTVEYKAEEIYVEHKTAVGLDYSQTGFYVSSENEIANYPHYYRELESKLAKEQRKLSNMELKSNNWYKQKKIISAIQSKIANQRKDWLHKKSSELVNKFEVICFEDIDLRNLAQCLSLGKNLHDNGFGMFRNFVKYKLEDQGKYFIKIDKWYPSTKMCHVCGTLNDTLTLADRKWTCDGCNTHHDRDYNAAINIMNEGLRLLINKVA